MKLLPLITLVLGYNQLVGAAGISNIEYSGEVAVSASVAKTRNSASLSNTPTKSSETKKPSRTDDSEDEDDEYIKPKSTKTASLSNTPTKSSEIKKPSRTDDSEDEDDNYKKAKSTKTKSYGKVSYTGTKTEKDDAEEKVKPTSAEATSKKYSEKEMEKAKKEVEKKKEELEKEIEKAAKRRNITSVLGDEKKVFKTVSKFANDTFKFWSEFRFATKPVPSFRAKFFDKSATGNETLYSYQVVIPAIVEFNDEIAADNSSSMKLLVKTNTSTWSNISATTTNIGDVSVTNFTTSYTDGKLTVRFSSFVSTGQANMSDGTALTPNGVKFSIDILGYQYQLKNSRLGLIMAISGKDDVVDSDSSFSVGTGGVFGWTSNATCDDITCAANVDPVSFNDSLIVTDSDSETKTEMRTYMVFSFDAIQPTVMMWDPSVAINDADLATQKTVSSMVEEIAAKYVASSGGASFAAFSLLVNLVAIAIAFGAF